MVGETKNIYDLLGEIIEKTEKTDKQSSTFNIFTQKVKIWIRKHYPDVLVCIGYIFSIHRLLYLISSCFWGIYYLNDRVLPNITNCIVCGIIIPMATWLYSTCFDFWNFHNRKMIGITIAILNSVMVFAVLIYQFEANLLLPYILKIPISSDITPGMILMLARFIMTLLLSLVLVAIMNLIIKNVYHDKSRQLIYSYKINRSWDTRKNKMFCYDMDIVRNLKSGKIQRIYEDDRFLHTMFIGTTGTGKTSTCMTTAINRDMDQRVDNEDYQKRKLSKWLKNGKIQMTKDFDDSDFSANYFTADTKLYQKKLKKLLEEIVTLGITAMAPNEKFSDELYTLAKSKKITVNRVDPLLNEINQHKEGFMGFNPLYISPLLEGIDRKIEIFSKARVFADVNQAIFEKNGGKGDPYFAGLNRNLTTSITVMVLLTYSHLNNGKQPTPDIVQNIINDFNKAQPYRDELVKLYSTKFIDSEKKIPQVKPGKADVGEYQFILDVIDKDVLGEGSTKMIDQARGLQNIINETLSNPLIRDVLCAENTIDIDRTLDKGEVTLINYAMNLGSAGTAFGMFYLLSYINAVLRRPTSKKLLPHFCYIDELPELLHPDLGRTFALFRQYRVGMNVALQSLDQFDKTAETKYLKSVVVGGCSHQIIFGRCSYAEMKLYQELSGTTEKITETNGTTETALSMEDTSMSMSHRETTEKVYNIEGGNMRYQEFRDVTVFTVQKGTPILPFYGRTFFLEDIKKIERRRFIFNWSKYFIPKEEFKEDDVQHVKYASVKESGTQVFEYQKTISLKSSDILEQIESEKESQNIVEAKEQKVYDNHLPADQIFISSGKKFIDKDNVDKSENDNNVDNDNKESNINDEIGFFIEEE